VGVEVEAEAIKIGEIIVAILRKLGFGERFINYKVITNI